MERLSAMDAAFLAGETDRFPMHGGGLMLFDPTTAAEGFGFEQFRAFLAERLAHVDRLRRRIITLPPGFGPPVFVDDPDFDIARHVHRVEVAPPGGRRELADAVSALYAQRLDRGHPMWRYDWFDGLADCRVAVLGTWHHALVDGMTAVKVLGVMFDTRPEARRLPPPRIERAPQPGIFELLADNTRRRLRAPGGLAAFAWETASGALRAVRATRVEGGAPLTLPFTAPRTTLDAEVTSRRSVAWVSLPLDAARRTRTAFGAKFNDVFLAIVGGALREYLLERGEVPDRPLTAVVPVSIHRLDAAGSVLDEGNLLSATFASLGTHIADPAERVHAVRAAMSSGKGFHEALGARTAVGFMNYLPPIVLRAAVEAYDRLRLGRFLPAAVSAVVSNVPGSPVPLYAAGARLVASYPLGPLEMTPLNITCISYDGSMDIGVVACPDVVDDVWALVNLFPRALDKLLACAEHGAA